MDLASERSYNTPYANSPLLPLLILSLMQQKNAPKTTTEFRKEYDFIIVGAGSAGSVVASRLSEVPCVSVLLLEAGKSPPLLTEVPGIQGSFWASDVSWNYKTVLQKHTARALSNRQISYPTGKTLGGTSVLNAMYYVRGNKQNFDDWAQQGAVGWSYSDVKPYFLKAENNTDPDYATDGYHVVDGPLTVSKQRYQSEIKNPAFEALQQMGYKLGDPNGCNQTGIYDPETTMRNGQRCSTAKAYLVPAENRKNLDIVKNAFVKKVIIKGNRAVGVLFEINGTSYTIKAKKEVIVSAGCINSAQLLMHSGIGPRHHLKQHNIPVVEDLPVGNNFQDHLGVYLYFQLDPSISSKEKKLQNTTNIYDYIDNRSGPLTSTLSDPLAYLISPSNKRFNFPDYQIYFGETAIPSPKNTFDIAPEVIRKHFRPYENAAAYRCWVHHLQPKSRGTVRLQSSNPYVPPLIDPNYLDISEDVKSLVEGLKTCKKIGTSEPMQKIGSKLLNGSMPGCEKSYEKEDDSYFECLARSTVLSYYHPVGTCKMGDPNDPTTVVCPNLKVKGIDGLRVVDASIMPTITSGNTNIPTIMIAEKASDMIKNTLNCYTQTPV